MDEDETTFPMDVYVADPSTPPWKFQPRGYLVAIFSDAEEAERGQAALVEKGFAAGDIKLYTSEQILDNYARYEEQRSRVSRVVGGIGDDEEGRALYLEYASGGGSAMWVRIPDEYKVPKALRILADFNVRYTRYYGDGKQQDYHIS